MMKTIRVQFGTNLVEDHLVHFVDPMLLWLTEHALLEEGVFRLSGNTRSVELLMERLNSGKSVDMCVKRKKSVHGGETKNDKKEEERRNSGASRGAEEEDDVHFTGVHDVSSLLRLYLRKLPEPLVTYDCYAMFLAVDSIPEQEKEARNDLLIKLLSYLPRANRKLLAMLCKFLHRVAQHEHKNKMNAKSLGTVLAPTIILRPREKQKETAPNELLREIKAAQNVIALLIDNYELFFGPLDENVNKVEATAGEAEGEEEVVVGIKVEADNARNEETKSDVHHTDSDIVSSEEMTKISVGQIDAIDGKTREALKVCDFDGEEADAITSKLKRLSTMLHQEMMKLNSIGPETGEPDETVGHERELSLGGNDANLFQTLHSNLKPSPLESDSDI